MAVTIVPASETRKEQLVHRGVDIEVTDYLGGHGYTGTTSDESVAQAFIVHLLSPGGVLAPHYHDVDQYQVVVRGDGHIGRHGVRTGSVHYTDHHTTYGPIVAGEHGLAFMTLRRAVAAGRYDMPESRAIKTTKSGDTFTEDADLSLPVTLPAIDTLATTSHGACAVLMRVPAGGDLPDPMADGAPAGYYLVLAGTVQCGEKRLDVESVAFRAAGDPPLAARAVHEGAVVAFLSFRERLRDGAAG
jgi:hypothetical protein